MKKREISTEFDDMISKTKLAPTVTELFIHTRKLNRTFAFKTQSCFAASKNVSINSIG